MKKLFLIVAAMFVAVSFSACSDDDDNKVDPNQIVGTWQITNEVGFDIGGEQAGERRDWNITYPVEEGPDHKFCYSYTFNDDGTGTYDSYDLYQMPNLVETWPLKYTVSNNTLNIPEIYEYHGTFEIKQLTKSQLVLFEKIDDNDGYKAEITTTFKRI